MKLIYFLAYITGNVFFTILTWKFNNSICTRCRVQKDAELLCYSSYFTMTILLQQFAPDIEIRFLGGLVLLTLLSLLYQDYWAKKIFSVLSLFLFNTFVHYGLILVSGEENLLLFTPGKFNALIGIALECILFYGFFVFVTFIRDFFQSNVTAIVDWAIALITPLCIAALLCIALVRAERNSDSLFFFSILLLVIVNVLALFSHGFRTLKTKLKLISYQNRYYQNQLEIIEASESAFKRLRHDLKNHLVILSDALNEENMDYAKEYLTTIFSELDSPRALSKTGNSGIDSLINYKLHCVNNLGIHLDYRAEIPSKLYIDAFDLTVILGNLLDNALESLERLPVSKDKKLSIKLKYENGRLIIKMSNTYDGVIFASNSEWLTRKKDASIHGIGLRNVRATISKYNGALKITHDQNLFTVYAIIYETLPSNNSEKAKICTK